MRSTAAADSAEGSIDDQQLQLKKRARRRLVGAVALALLAVIVLPMVMDQEPRPLGQDIQIRIPSQDASAVSTLARGITGRPAPTPLPALQKTVEVPVEPSTAAPASRTGSAAKSDSSPPQAASQESRTSVAVAQVSKAPETKAPPDQVTPRILPGSAPVEPAAGSTGGEQWEVQLGAYQDQANVKALQTRLKSLGLPSFTERVDTPQGMRTRVRGGPFANRAAAEKAQAQLKKLAIGAPAGGVVAQKP